MLVSRFLNPKLGGAAFDLIEQLRAGPFEIVVSKEILAEVQSVLLRGRIRKRYKFKNNDVVDYVSELLHVATVLEPKSRVHVSRDPSDDMVLDCALDAKAKYIVTRDEDLLSIGALEMTEIVTPERLLNILRDPRNG